jgi:hypothetical protein
MYALNVHGTTSGVQNLLVGSLDGGEPKVFAFLNGLGTIAIVGWTTM